MANALFPEALGGSVGYHLRQYQSQYLVNGHFPIAEASLHIAILPFWTLCVAVELLMTVLQVQQLHTYLCEANLLQPGARHSFTPSPERLSSEILILILYSLTPI